ncbi:hypothetical protein [Porphyromonas pogonae]|uniref:hypothetical protein n=1 Tax=Porphyromonas pogonae TaxID=867595 RepID=UPI002E792C64|nr:hypothetical protein [Porphyromonas pogonae]
MKKSLKCIGFMLFALVAVAFVSCSKDTDPTEVDVFLGSYTGSISYIKGDKIIKPDSGKVTVAKAGSEYMFAFSDGIPDLKDVKFNKKDDHTWVGISSGMTGLITISKDKLVMAVTKDGAAWTANCSR